jgi:hypothetical protein
MSDSIVVLFQVYHVATIGFKLELSQPAIKCLTRIMSWKSFLSIEFTQPEVSKPTRTCKANNTDYSLAVPGQERPCAL